MFEHRSSSYGGEFIWIANVSEVSLLRNDCSWFELGSNIQQTQSCQFSRGWSGGAMVLGKLPEPGRPTNLDWSRARAYCALQ